MPKERNICKNEGCDRLCRKGHECDACQKRRWRSKNPMEAAYANLRASAKRRGHAFTISFEYFKKFAVKHEYIQKKGRSATGYGVDRKKPELGYVEGNLQLLTNTDNIKKKYLDRRLAAETGQYKVFEVQKKPKKEKYYNDNYNDKGDEVPF